MIYKVKRQILHIFYSIFIIYGISWVAIDSLIPLIEKELGVGYDKMGIALFIGSAIMLLLTFISGWLSDKFDIKKIVIVGLILLFLVFLIFAININYLIFIIVILLMRMGYGILDTSLHTFSSKLFKENIGEVFINNSMFWYIGGIIGPLLTSFTLFFDIKPKFIFLFLSLAYAIVFIVFYRVCPSRNIKDEVTIKETIHSSSINKNIFSLLKNPKVILCSLITFFFAGAMVGFSTWFTTYFLAFDLNVSLSSLLLSLHWVFATLGLFSMRILIKRIRETKLLIWGYIIGIIGLFIFSLCPIFYIKIATLIILSISFSGVYPLINTISAQIDFKNTGSILGFVFAFTFAGSIVFQPIMGYVAEYFGENFIIFVVLGGIILRFVFLIYLLRLLKKEIVLLKT